MQLANASRNLVKTSMLVSHGLLFRRHPVASSGSFSLSFCLELEGFTGDKPRLDFIVHLHATQMPKVVSIPNQACFHPELWFVVGSGYLGKTHGPDLYRMTRPTRASNGARAPLPSPCSSHIRHVDHNPCNHRCSHNNSQWKTRR